MRRLAVILVACWCLSAVEANAQTQNRASSLATLFEEVYGPNGLVLSSDDVTLDGTTHAAHFNSAFQSDFRLVNIALTGQLTAIPLPSPASGFTYEFDSATGTFVRSTRSFGPILSDRAETIGRGRLAFGFSNQFFSFDHLDGVSLSAVPAVFRHDSFELGGGRADVVSTTNTIQASVGQFAGALTYGLTSRIDLSLAVPIVRTSLSLLSNARIQRLGTGTNLQVHYFQDPTALGGFGSTHQYFTEGTASGVGDLVLRMKTMLIREGSRALAAGIDARLPTGDELNLLGTGAMGMRPWAAVSSAFGPFAPHANISYQWNGKSVLAGDVRAGTEANLPDQFQYAAGTDLAVNPKFSMVFDVLGQRVLNSPVLSVYTLDATGAAGSASLPDIRFSTDSYWVTDASLGFKANVASRLLVNFNMRFNVGDKGLADRVAPLIGVEWSF
jgi:hypothetical protein